MFTISNDPMHVDRLKICSHVPRHSQNWNRSPILNKTNDPVANWQPPPTVFSAVSFASIFVNFFLKWLTSIWIGTKLGGMQFASATERDVTLEVPSSHLNIFVDLRLDLFYSASSEIQFALCFIATVEFLMTRPYVNVLVPFTSNFWNDLLSVETTRI